MGWRALPAQLCKPEVSRPSNVGPKRNSPGSQLYQMSQLEKGPHRWIQFVNIWPRPWEGPAGCFRIKQFSRALGRGGEIYLGASGSAQDFLSGLYVRASPWPSLALLPPRPELLPWGGTLIPGVWYSARCFVAVSIHGSSCQKGNERQILRSV